MLIALLSQLASEGRAAETFDGQTFYFGDLHAHTGVSPDGGSQEYGDCTDTTVCGYIENVFDDARDVYHLDFVSFTDHSAPDTDPDQFNELLGRGLLETSSTFVVIPGAERVLRYDDINMFGEVGHKTNLVFDDDRDLLGSLAFADFKGGTKRFASCDDAVGGVWEHPATLSSEFGPSLEFAHHPAAGNIMTTDWSCHDQRFQPVVEVYSGWGNSLDPDSTFDPLQEPIAGTFVHDALEEFGLRVGFVSGTDIHDTRPGAVCAVDTTLPEGATVPTHIYGGGLTMIALPEGETFARPAIYGELVARRSLVTTGPQMPVSVHWITPDGVAHAIGEELVMHDSVSEWTTLSVKIPSDWDGYVVGVRAVGVDGTSFDLTDQVEGEWSVAIPNDQLLLARWLYAEVAIDGALFYGAGVCVDEPMDDDLNGDGFADPIDDREFVWSSPVWFDFSSDIDGDTYAYDDLTASDCNDYDVAIYPGAPEIWTDGIDQDCDGHDLDIDGDGYAYGVGPGLDCDDTNASIYWGADEVWTDGIDQDCDGHDLDIDGDGYLFLYDCNDFDPAVNRFATELCGPDDVDEDCDELIDDADPDTVPSRWWIDNDHDTYGRNTAPAFVTCETVAGHVTRNGDCNDRNPRISPDAIDIPNNDVDENCDGRDRRSPTP